MKSNNRNSSYYVGRSIRSPRVHCIDNEGKNLGVIPTMDALRMAEQSNLDLVQIVPSEGGKPPTCRIMDYGKFKYDQSKKQKAAEKKQRESEIKLKEIQFRPVTDMNDLRIKAKKVQEFLEEGARIKIMIRFRGREVAHKQVAMQTLQEFMEMIPMAQMSGPPSMEGTKYLIVTICRAVESVQPKNK